MRVGVRRWMERSIVWSGVVAVGIGGAVGAGVPIANAAGALPTLPFGTPIFTVNVNSPAAARGRIMYTTGMAAAVPFAANVPGLEHVARQSAVIADRSGKVVFRYTPPQGQQVGNFRTQRYHGAKVLTWWQGTGGGGHGAGVGVIADLRGHILKKVRPGELTADIHEFRLTDDGKALFTSYPKVSADLRSVGGPARGAMFDCVASVVDVETSRPIFTWSAKEHVPVSYSTQRPGDLQSHVTQFDPFHMNSIVIGPDGNLLMSFRDLNAIYNVDIHTGQIRWRLGGKHPDFVMGKGTSMFGQHDAEYADDNTIRFFDNNIDGASQQGRSSIKWIRIDPVHHRATLVRAQFHPAGLASAAMGNAFGLSNGNVVGSWGMAPHISEFAPNGAMVYDATLPVGTYRAFVDEE